MSPGWPWARRGPCKKLRLRPRLHPFRAERPPPRPRRPGVRRGAGRARCTHSWGDTGRKRIVMPQEEASSQRTGGRGLGVRGSREQGPSQAQGPFKSAFVSAANAFAFGGVAGRAHKTRETAIDTERRGGRPVRLLPRPVCGGAKPPLPPAGVLCLKAARGRVAGGRCREAPGPGAATGQRSPRRPLVPAPSVADPLPPPRPGSGENSEARPGRVLGLQEVSRAAGLGRPLGGETQINPGLSAPSSHSDGLRPTLTSCRPRQAADCLFCHLMDVEP